MVGDLLHRSIESISCVINENIHARDVPDHLADAVSIADIKFGQLQTVGSKILNRLQPPRRGPDSAPCLCECDCRRSTQA